MGTSSARSSSNTEYFTRGDKIPGLQVRLFPYLLPSLCFVASGYGPFCSASSAETIFSIYRPDVFLAIFCMQCRALRTVANPTVFL